MNTIELLKEESGKQLKAGDRVYLADTVEFELPDDTEITDELKQKMLQGVYTPPRVEYTIVEQSVQLVV